MKRSLPEACRRALAIREGGKPGQTTLARCHYCGQEGRVSWARRSNGEPSHWVTFPGLELDHVVPFIAGGVSCHTNTVLACVTCNRSKGHRNERPMRTGYYVPWLPKITESVVSES